MPKGGRQPGAGRPVGSKNKSTLEKQAAEKELHNRILGSVDRLFNAQLSLAQGVSHVYRIDEVGEGKQKKREHNLVTDPDEIKSFLDECDGGNGTVDGAYYYITTKEPDNKAIDSMLDRVFGRATNKTEVTGKNGGDIVVKTVVYHSPDGTPHQTNPEATPGISGAEQSSD